MAALVAAAVVAGLLVLQGQEWRIPERWNPFAPLRIAEHPGWLTRFKLHRLDADPERCMATLADSGFSYTPIADSSSEPGCGFANAVRISRTSLALGSPITLSCTAAVSLALWERHAVLPAAEQHLRRPLVRIDHLGSYACRNIYGRESAPRSRHASADALDIAGFGLAGGGRVRVLGGWNGDAAEAAFLHAIRDGACRFFDGVLSPDYNTAHADHLHVERHGSRVCR